MGNEGFSSRWSVPSFFNVKSCFKSVDYAQGQGVPQIGSGAYFQYVSISIRGTTPPLSVICAFETAFRRVP